MLDAPQPPAQATIDPRHGGLPPQHAPYRGDIDGLRAIAILPVLLFHAGIPGFGGGFVGVDVFFVISGYLITTIIADALRAGSFSLLDFYERRIRRIFPALMTVIAVTFVLTILMFLPDDLEHFARSAMSAALFSANIFYYQKASYFSTEHAFKPLLHTWSLGVEEQFYIFYPLILMLLHRWAGRWLFVVLLVLASLSFLASVWWLPVWPRAVFYLANFRAWELFAGAIVALKVADGHLGPIGRGLAGGIGLGLIAFAVFRYDATTLFPGAAALLPCGGTAALLYAGAKGSSWARSFLEVTILRFIGLISYSTYLWHWPIITLYRYSVFPDDSISAGPMLVLASLAAGTLSWWYVERPFRTKLLVKQRASVFKYAAAATATVLVLGGVLTITRGLKGRFPALEASIAAMSPTESPAPMRCTGTDLMRDPLPLMCLHGDRTKAPTYALWGDSHAAQLAAALGERVAQRSASMVEVTRILCPPALDYALIRRTGCRAENAAALAFLLAHPTIDRVVLAAHYSSYDGGASSGAFRRGFLAAIQKLNAAGKKVYVVYPTPESGMSIPQTAALYLAHHKDPGLIAIARRAYDALNNRTIAFLDSLKLDGGRIDPTRALCDAKVCRVFWNGKLLYYDPDHLSREGAKLLVQLFDPGF